MKIKEFLKKRMSGANFWTEEKGLALTEYLILLGLLSGGAIVAVLAVGDKLQKAWGGWASYYSSDVVALAGPQSGPQNISSSAPSETVADTGQTDNQTQSGGSSGAKKNTPKKLGHKKQKPKKPKS